MSLSGGHSSGCVSALESGQTVSVALAAAVKSQKHNTSLECCILEWGDAGFELPSSLFHVKQSRRRGKWIKSLNLIK